MKRRRAMQLLLLMLQGRSSMANERVRPPPQPLWLSATGLSGVRMAPGFALRLLVADDSHPRLRRLLALNFSAAAQPALLDPPQSVRDLPGRLDWDARLDQNHWQVVSLHAGSGVAPLLLFNPGLASGRPVDEHNLRGIFSTPRFTGEMGAITAVNVDGGYSIALYTPLATGLYLPRRLLPLPVPGIVQAAQLLQWRGQPLLLVQTFAPGPYRLQGQGRSATVQRSGRLAVQALDANWQPVGAAWHPLGDQPVFEFAAAQAGERLGLLATTPTGFVLAQGSPDLEGRGFTLIEENWPTELLSPCLQAVGNGWRIVLLQQIDPMARGLLWVDWSALSR